MDVECLPRERTNRVCSMARAVADDAGDVANGGANNAGYDIADEPIVIPVPANNNAAAKDAPGECTLGDVTGAHSLRMAASIP